MQQPKTTGRLIETAERRTFILTLRKSGATYEQIAQAALSKFGEERLPKGWDRRYAWMDVSRELQRLNRECQQAAAEIKRLELERIDVALRSIWKQVRSGHLGAIDRFVKLSARRARLCGLDAPTGVDVTSMGEQILGPIIFLPAIEGTGGVK